MFFISSRTEGSSHYLLVMIGLPSPCQSFVFFLFHFLHWTLGLCSDSFVATVAKSQKNMQQACFLLLLESLQHPIRMPSLSLSFWRSLTTYQLQHLPDSTFIYTLRKYTHARCVCVCVLLVYISALPDTLLHEGMIEEVFGQLNYEG